MNRSTKILFDKVLVYFPPVDIAVPQLSDEFRWTYQRERNISGKKNNPFNNELANQLPLPLQHNLISNLWKFRKYINNPYLPDIEKIEELRKFLLHFYCPPSHPQCDKSNPFSPLNLYLVLLIIYTIIEWDKQQQGIIDLATKSDVDDMLSQIMQGLNMNSTSMDSTNINNLTTLLQELSMEPNDRTANADALELANKLKSFSLGYDTHIYTFGKIYNKQKKPPKKKR